MILPRSPVAKSFIGLVAVSALITLSWRYQSVNSQDYSKLPLHHNNQGNLPEETYEKPTIPNTFKVPESLHLTHDVAIPHDLPAWTQKDTDMLYTTIGSDLRTQLLKQGYEHDEDLTNKPERVDFAEIARAERVYKALWNYVHPIFEGLSGSDRERESKLIELAKTRPEIEFFLKLENRLFPWVHHGRRTSFSLYRSYKGRGLIFCAGNGQFEFLVTAIQSLRYRLKTTLPIQVFHMGEHDLSKERQEYLRAMAKDIQIVDVTTIVDNSYTKLSGWAIKPFAMLASSFEEVMFIDADAYFLHDPVILFDDPGYLATGALFFYDRTLFGRSGSATWINTVSPYLSTFTRSSRLYRFLTAHEQESGVVLINKKTRFVGMLAICKSNGKWERDLVSYKKFHGDKETFWSGFEMVQEPYVFMRNYGGVIGELWPDNPGFVCGAQLHQDHQGRPLWWNGGLYRNKNAGVTRNLNFGYWMSGGGQQKHRERFTKNPEHMKQVLLELGLNSADQLSLEPGDPEWNFGESCLGGGQVNSLNQRESELANGYIEIDRMAREDAQKINHGEKPNPNNRKWDS